MKLNKKTLIMVVGLVLSLAVGLGGTLAYLTDTDADVNTMVLGNVKIEQYEYERVLSSDGYGMVGDGYKLQEFTQDKPLYPSVGEVTGWDETVVPFDQIGGEGNMQVLDGKENVVDKFVVVKNTGNSAAYVRTLIAYELGTMTYERWAQVFMTSKHNFWSAEDVGVIEIDDNKYVLVEYCYDRALEAGKVARCSLAQFYLRPEATNEDVAALDGNENGKYDIIVLSQAVQTAGFDSAEVALNEGFGAPAALAAEWFDGALEELSKPTVDHWDGTSDTSWYNDTDTEFTLTTAEHLAGLSKLVNDGNTFEGKTVKLGDNICLSCADGCAEKDQVFTPIGDNKSDSVFMGTFDGQNHTVANLYQNGWALGYQWGSYGSCGMFGIADNVTVKNLKMTGMESLIEGGDVSFIAGSATGTCVFENITIENGDIATYNNGCGGIIGWSGAGNYTFKNITLAEDVELTGLWGSFDSSIGGVVGQGEPGATYNFENVDIACRLNAFNDCTASNDFYNYRMCGMIIGRLEETTTIDGTNYPDTSKYNITCNNVKVTYGEWANYHYCDPTPGLNGGRGMRVEPGYSYDGIPADYDHSQCTTHCNALIPFDQVFGGDQYGVKGLKAYDGVTVVYNNK